MGLARLWEMVSIWIVEDAGLPVARIKLACALKKDAVLVPPTFLQNFAADVLSETTHGDADFVIRLLCI